MRATLTTSEAETRFTEALRIVQGGGLVEITQSGTAIAALVSVENLSRLKRLRSADPGEGLAGLAGLWEDGDELAADLDRIAASRTPPRPMADLE